jgi:hypothetical protein
MARLIQTGALRGRLIVVVALVCSLAPVASGQPAPPQPAAGATGEAGIREALQQYSDALERLDADAVKRVHPSIEVENLRKAFREMRTLSVMIDEIKVLAADSMTARVSCRVTQALTPKAGSRQTTGLTRVVRLRRQADSWVIDAFER